jgi:hypothetical protein
MEVPLLPLRLEQHCAASGGGCNEDCVQASRRAGN